MNSLNIIDDTNDIDNEFNELLNTYQEELDGLKLYFEDNINIKPKNIISENTLYNCNYKYIYPGLELLNDDLMYTANKYDHGNIHICAYNINNNGQFPFIQYILRKYNETHKTKKDQITFPNFKYTKNYPIMDFNNLILEIIYKSYKIKTGKYEYKGFINNNNQFYVFYDFTTCNINIHELTRQNDLWLVSMDEILNHKNVCNFPIDSLVTNFFIDSTHIDFNYLLDYDKNIIETPIIAYTDAPLNKLNFILYFGESESFHDELIEPYFYFSNYQKILLKNQLLNNNYGIVRFALFLGYMKIYDIYDIQETETETEKCEYENNIIYKNSCDSVYIGNIDGNPKWALTKYEQQCPNMNKM